MSQRHTIELGPKPLTIEEYKRRTKIQAKVVAAPEVPPVHQKTRRGGKIQKLKREKALLQRLIKEINKNTPWKRSCELWDQLADVEFLLKQHQEKKNKN